MSKPAARLGDPTMHGGTIVIGFPTVLIGGKPAARIGDMHVCPMVTPGTPPIPHIGGPITMGAPTVLIGNMPAACMGDMATCIGPPDTIAMGCPTVLIGMAGGGGAGAAGAAAGAAAPNFAVKTERRGGLFGAIIGGIVGAILGAVAGAAIGGLPGAIVGGVVGVMKGAAVYQSTAKKKFGENYIKTLESTETGKDIAKTLKGKKTKILPMTDEVRDKHFGKGGGRDALNLKVGNNVYIDPVYDDTKGASHLAHEGQHIVDDAMPYKTNQEILEVETRAFESEVKIWKELKIKNPELKDSTLDAWEESYDNGSLRQDVADLYYDSTKGTKGK